MAKDKIDLVLEEIGGLKKDLGVINGRLGSLEQGQKSLEQGQQRNYELIQKQGLRLEQLSSDVKAVAEGHGVLLNKVDEVKSEVRGVGDRLDAANRVVGETNRMMKEHIRQPAHA